MGQFGEHRDSSITKGSGHDLGSPGQTSNWKLSEVEGSIKDEPLILDNVGSLGEWEPTKPDEFIGAADNTEILGVVDNTTFHEVLQELNNEEPSEELKAAILEAFFMQADSPEASKAMEDATVSEALEGTDTKEIAEAPGNPPPDPSLQNLPPVGDGMFPCPFRKSLGCVRTFTHAGYAKNHSKVHTHHVRCHFKSCRSRLQTHEGLAAHLDKSHGLEDIADLDHSFRERLRQVEGKYCCRFRDLLGCNRLFSQNGHANRHALLHCKKAIPCNVRGCRKKFMHRSNCEAHFWESHYQVLD